jgi:hypothetical protein
MAGKVAWKTEEQHPTLTRIKLLLRLLRLRKKLLPSQTGQIEFGVLVI